MKHRRLDEWLDNKHLSFHFLPVKFFSPRDSDENDGEGDSRKTSFAVHSADG
jgi:hypothetical protein